MFWKKRAKFKKKDKNFRAKKKDKKSSHLRKSREQKKNIINSYVQMSYIHIL